MENGVGGKLTRRSLMGGLAALPLMAAAAHGQGIECAVFTPERQDAKSPEAAIARLKAGNERFLAGQSINCDLLQQVHDTSGGQAPFAAVVGCIDSRVPPELVFDQRVGDFFCARVAGNFVNTDILGSLEFATHVAGARAIVILGHSACGAIKSAVDGVELGHITAMLKNFDPALATLGPADGARSSANEALVQKVADQNALLTAQSLVQRSDILAQLVADGKLAIASAMHDIQTGRITWLS